ncbi:hypothetical protein [uncultured Thomasclavelia sp.]|uniref:hypothetical protein n=1 Tax=uncultured Thomasclavelia sp. TaxID=3025759 RepID=UPI0025E0A300|nr:hypothetical protein [uncultured Thomasclavelia sp.]
MRKIQDALYRFMAGRYGSDQLNMFILIVAIILIFINIFLVNSQIIAWLVWVLLIFEIFRTYSRNIYQRRKENEKFLAITSPIKKRYLILKNNHHDKQHKYFLCPNCKQMVRVPRGRGKITITCPKCSQKFDKKC